MEDDLVYKLTKFLTLSFQFNFGIFIIRSLNLNFWQDFTFIDILTNYTYVNLKKLTAKLFSSIVKNN